MYRTYLFVLLAVLPVLASAKPLKACPGAKLKCANGGTIDPKRCFADMKICENSLNPFSRCLCPPGFAGLECDLATSAKVCPPGSKFYTMPIDENAVIDSQCTLPNIGVFKNILPLRDARLHLSIDAIKAEVRFQLLGRATPLMGSACSPVLQLADCVASKCKEVKSALPKKRQLECSKVFCRSCRDTGHPDRPHCPYGVSPISALNHMSPFRVDFDVATKADNTFQSSVIVPLPGGNTKIEVTCRTGFCSRPQKRLESSLAVLEPGSGEVEAVDGAICWVMYFAYALAAAVLIFVIAAVAQAQVKLLLPIPPLQPVGYSEIVKPRFASFDFGLIWRRLSFSVTSSTKARFGGWAHARHQNKRFPVLSKSAGSTHALLQPASGSLAAGELVALIGSSGAGKSTLLRLLSDASTRPGCPVELLSDLPGRVKVRPRDVVAFVTQNDFALAALTVYETVRFAARTRLAKGTSKSDIHAAVSSVLKELQLEDVASTLVGHAEKGGGLSGGQRRRLTIAVEMVADPRVMILDEPLTGLDSTSASIVLRALRRRALERRCAILLSIHQPSADVWNLFDRVMVMGFGGKRLFDGTMDHALAFFRAFGLAFDKGTNPWEFLLQSIANIDSEQILEAFEQSKHFEQVSNRVDELELSLHRRSLHASAQRRFPANDLSLSSSKKAWWQEVLMLCSRSFRHVARDPRLLFGYCLLTILMAVTSGFVFFQVDNRLQGAINRSGFFAVAALINFLISLVSMDVFISERTLFRRERAAGCYSCSAYFVSKLVVDVVPFRIIPSLLYGSIVYYIVGLQPHFMNFVLFNVILMLHNIASGAFIFALSCACDRIGQANLSATIFLLYNLAYGTSLANHKPSSALLMKVLQALSPFHYAVQAFHVNEFPGLNLIIDPKGIDLVTYMSGEVWLSNLGMYSWSFIKDLVSLLAYSFIMFGIAYFLLWRRDAASSRHCVSGDANADDESSETSTGPRLA